MTCAFVLAVVGSLADVAEAKQEDVADDDCEDGHGHHPTSEAVCQNFDVTQRTWDFLCCTTTNTVATIHTRTYTFFYICMLIRTRTCGLTGM